MCGLDECKWTTPSRLYFLHHYDELFPDAFIGETWVLFLCIIFCATFLPIYLTFGGTQSTSLQSSWMTSFTCEPMVRQGCTFSVCQDFANVVPRGHWVCTMVNITKLSIGCISLIWEAMHLPEFWNYKVIAE